MVVGLSLALVQDSALFLYPQLGRLLHLPNLALGDVGAVDAGRAVGALADAGGLAVALGALELLADGADAGGDGVGDGGGVAEVLVDAGKDVTVGGRDTVDGHVALVHGVAVAAGAVQLSEALDGEVGDGDSAGSVVLDDLLFDKALVFCCVADAEYSRTSSAYLVISVESTTTNDLGGRASLLVLDGESVLADGRPPDVGQSASTLAVDTLDLVGADDDVGDAAALLDLEDSVGVATLRLAGARDATVEHDHATIEGLASGNGLGSRQGRGAGRRRQRAAGRGTGAGRAGSLGAAAAGGAWGSTARGLGRAKVNVADEAFASAAESSAVSLELGRQGGGSKSHGRKGNSVDVELHFEGWG